MRALKATDSVAFEILGEPTMRELQLLYVEHMIAKYPRWEAAGRMEIDPSTIFRIRRRHAKAADGGDSPGQRGTEG